MRGTIAFLRQHPLTRDHLPTALWRVLRYQVSTRLRTETVIPWVEGTRLAVRRNMSGASGNVYAGLHEFADMGFLIHMLRPGDVFFDIGANVGSWTVLASALCGARTVAFEPDPDSAFLLGRNIAVNGIGTLVEVRQTALAEYSGTARFTRNLGTVNHLAEDGKADAREVHCATLDALRVGSPTVMKIDVEGAEERVLAGASATLQNPALAAVLIETFEGPVEERLRAMGFRRFFYDPTERALSRNANGIAANNALFVRDIDFCRARVADAAPRTVLGRPL